MRRGALLTTILFMSFLLAACGTRGVDTAGAKAGENSTGTVTIDNRGPTEGEPADKPETERKEPADNRGSADEEPTDNRDSGGERQTDNRGSGEGNPDDPGGSVKDGERSFSETPEAIEKAAASVVKLEVYDRFGEKLASGSGFCMFDETVLVTAAHVTANMAYMTATRDDGETFRIDTVIAGSTERDIAICRLPEGVRMTPLPGARGMPLRGEKLVVIGSQFGVVNLATLGNLAKVWESGSGTRLLFTAPVSAGNSGGPVFDSGGNVVGIVSGTYDKGQNMNIAVPASEAEEMYNGIGDTVPEE